MRLRRVLLGRRRRSVIVYVLWRIWKARNVPIFDGKLRSASSVQRNAEVEMRHIGRQRMAQSGMLAVIALGHALLDGKHQ